MTVASRCSVQPTLAAVAAGLLLFTCGTTSAPVVETRPHDARTFDAVTPTMEPVAGATLYQGTYAGVKGQPSYQIEVPGNWNGTLVMPAHG